MNTANIIDKKVSEYYPAVLLGYTAHNYKTTTVVSLYTSDSIA